MAPLLGAGNVLPPLQDGAAAKNVVSLIHDQGLTRGAGSDGLVKHYVKQAVVITECHPRSGGLAIVELRLHTNGLVTPWKPRPGDGGDLISGHFANL